MNQILLLCLFLSTILPVPDISLLPHNIINLNRAVQFTKIRSSNPEMPNIINKHKITKSPIRIYASAMLLVLLWLFDQRRSLTN